MSDHELSVVDGIRIVSERVPSVRSVSVAVWIGVGSRDETDDSRGYAHFVEHLLFKGNERWTAEGISNFFDGIGSDGNAATTKEYTVVHSRVIDRHVGDALEVFGNMVLAPAFAPGDVDSERDVILEEIAMYNDSPSDVVHELADELVFHDHPLGPPIVGTEASISAATVADVQAFHAKHYVPSNLVISAAGSLDHAELVELVRTRFLPAASAQVAARAHAHTRELAAPSLHRSARVVQKETEQVHVCLVGPGVARDDDRRYAAAVLDTILGSTPSSRLFNEIREQRGLAYSVYSYVSHHAETGELGVYVGVRPDRVRTTFEVLAEELERMRTTLPGDDELARARDHLEGRLLLSLESTTVRGNRLGSSVLTGMPLEDPDTVIERVRAVTAEQVRDLAAELLAPERLSFAAVAEAPDEVQAAATELLGIGSATFVSQPAQVAS